MPPQTAYEKAVTDVREAMLDRSKRHLLQGRQQRMFELQRLQLPGMFHAGTEMIPGYTSAELPAAAPPHQPVWQQRAEDPRNTSATNLFLERTLQSMADDRLRDIGFRLLDRMGLEVEESTTPNQLILKNEQTGEAIVLNEREFMAAVEFIAGSDTVDKASTKTRELLRVIDRKVPAKVITAHPEAYGYLERPAPMTEQQQKRYESSVRQQESLALIREDIEPARAVKRKKTWRVATETRSGGCSNCGGAGRASAVYRDQSCCRGYAGAR